MAGLSFAITAVWLGMRSVMDIGGSCASGGPYQVAVECPQGVDVIMFLAFPIGFLSAGLMLWKGALLGDRYMGLVALAWPALFLSLGWNFLVYAFDSTPGGGIEFGWLIPGVIFVIMGGVPLLGWIMARGHGHVVPGVPATRTPIELNELSRVMRNVAVSAAARSGGSTSSTTVAEAMRAPGTTTTPGTRDALVSQLERLSALHTGGQLSDAEYDQAKRTLLDAASRGELG